MNVVDRHGDIYFKDGELVKIGVVDDIKQELETVFNTWQGEYFLDPELGVKYENILGKQVSDDDIMIEVVNAVAQVERVTDILKVDIDRNNMNRTVEITLELEADEEVFDFKIALGGD